MWNGFTGDSGHQAIKYSTIPLAICVSFLYALLDRNDLNVYTTITNIHLNDIFPSVMDIGYGMAWIIFSWILFMMVPGTIEKGPINNSGNRYKYKLNSLNCLILVSILQFVLHILDIVPGDIFSRNYSRVVITFTWLGFIGSIIFYLKGLYFPTFNNVECKSRNNFIEDFYSGIELAPRWNYQSTLDIKLFVVGHLGMVIWHLMNVSHGIYGSNMNNPTSIIICVLQLIYILDWAWNERWYLYTIDMQHDRLGFYLGFGGITWMVTTYTAYGFYTSRSVTTPSNLVIIAAIVLYLGGYALMRISNNQKETFRRHPQNLIWGKRPKYLIANYKTVDGHHRQNTLLLSGFWGWSRHFNYIGDLLLCISLSILCDYTSVGAHIYTFQMFGLLYVRAHRDDLRCQLKYGSDWSLYKTANPYLLIPGIY
jgi:7-dehydrocholesterol reductase